MVRWQKLDAAPGPLDNGSTMRILARLTATLSFGVAASAAAYDMPAFQGELRGSARAPDSALSLWYRRPAREWVEALALGNGRLGAMMFGGIDEEQLQLNEDTLWAGGPHGRRSMPIVVS